MAKRGGVTKRADGRYQKVIGLGRKPNGKPDKKYIYGKTAREVQQKVREFEANFHAGVLPTRGDITVEALMHEWMKREVTGRLSHNTVRNYASVIRCHINPNLGDMRLSKVDAYTIQVFLDDVCGKQSNLCPRMVALVRVVLMGAWKKAVDWEWAGRNPVEKTRPPKKSGEAAATKARRILSVSEAQRVTTACRQRRNLRVALLMLWTGLRWNEARSIQWQLLDLTEGLLDVRSQLMPAPGGGYLFASLKTGASRAVINLHPEIVEMLREQRHDQRLMRAEGDLDLVFTTPRGAVLRRDTVAADWRALLEELGIAPIGLHDIRHTFISLLAAMHTPFPALKLAARHSSLATTMNVYSHAVEGDQARTTLAIGDLLGGEKT